MGKGKGTGKTGGGNTVKRRDRKLKTQQKMVRSNEKTYNCRQRKLMCLTAGTVQQ